MLPLRQRAAALLARPVRWQAAVAVTPSSPRFASTEHHHDAHHGHEGHHEAHADEPMGTGFYIAVGSIPVMYALYALSRPGKDGQVNPVENLIQKYSEVGNRWEVRNTVRTAAYEQAAHDRNLLQTAERNTHIELRYPETFQSKSPYSVPAGHYINLDKVVAHYKEQYDQEVERQANAAALREAVVSKGA